MVRRVGIGWLGRRDGRSNDPALVSLREQREVWALATTSPMGSEVWNRIELDNRRKWHRIVAKGRKVEINVI